MSKSTAVESFNSRAHDADNREYEIGVTCALEIAELWCAGQSPTVYVPAHRIPMSPASGLAVGSSRHSTQRTRYLHKSGRRQPVLLGRHCSRTVSEVQLLVGRDDC